MPEFLPIHILYIHIHLYYREEQTLGVTDRETISSQLSLV